MKSFVIADLHFGHKNIINLCNRPFASVDIMNEYLILAWNNIVSKQDRVYILGDFALTRNKQEVANYVSQLNGQKYLIMGNHDSLKVKDYYEAGFDFVSKYPIVLKGFYILSHEPMFVNSNCPYYNIFGHVHDNPIYATKTEQSWCVSVERQDYKPVELIFNQEDSRK